MRSRRPPPPANQSPMISSVQPGCDSVVLGELTGRALYPAVAVGGVEEVDADLVRVIHDGVRFGGRGQRPEVHRAEAEAANAQAGTAKVDVFHAPTLSRHRAFTRSWPRGARPPARGCRRQPSSSGARCRGLRSRTAAAGRRLAEPAGRRLPLGQQHGQRQAGGGEEPFGPGRVVAAVHVQVPAGPAAVGGQPGRVSARPEQGVDPVRGGGDVPGREDLLQIERGLAEPGQVRVGDLDRLGLPRAPAAPRSARRVRSDGAAGSSRVTRPGQQDSEDVGGALRGVMHAGAEQRPRGRS